MKIKVIHNIPDGDSCRGCSFYTRSSSYDMDGSCINMYCNLFRFSDFALGVITNNSIQMKKCDKCRSLKEGDTIDLTSK